VTGPHGLPDLSHEETLRYSRHLTLPEVGAAGQRRLKAGRVVVIVLMFIGRLGPILFLSALQRLQEKKRFMWPEESMLIGCAEGRL